jgi:ATP-dependent helicase/nuclease subunit A
VSTDHALEALRRQAMAADPGANVFVTANAGSGKTKVLIDRIARLLLAGFAPGAFLCITYTKAAAAEMQRRLFERLGRWCVATDEGLAKELAELIGAEGEMAPERLAAARALFARALETPGGLKIQTIHAFCERLLRRFPLEAQIAPGFEIAEDSETARLRQRAWDRLGAAESEDAAGRALDRLARRLDGERFDKAGAALLANRANLRAARARDAQTLRVRHQNAREAAVVRAELLDGAPWADLLDAARRLDASGANDQKLAARIRDAHTAAPVERLDAYRAIFLTDSGAPRKNIVTTGLMGKDAALARLFGPTGEPARFDRLMAELISAERLDDALALDELARCLGGAYEELKAAHGVIDFEDLVERASALLSLSAAAPWVLYKLDGGIDHILIDEGQDTSPAQWSLVEPLQQEFFSGSGARAARRTVFAVGDPKQSIYSFQGADPARFRDEAQKLEARARQAGRKFRAPDLEMSFRSSPEVLQAVDAVFAQAGLGAAGADGGNVPRHVARRSGEGGSVEWWPTASPVKAADRRPWDAPKESLSAVSAAAQLAKACADYTQKAIVEGLAIWDEGRMRPVRPGDVLVLVQSRGPLFKQMLRAFKRAGLPVAGADRMTLSAELAVKDLIACAQAALDPADDMAVACALKSPLIGLIDDDADLFPLAYGREKGETLWSRLALAGEPRFVRARTVLEGCRARIGLAPYEFFASLLEERDAEGRTGWARMFARLGVEARDPIEELLSRALAFADGATPHLFGFVKMIVEDESSIKREMDQAGDVVRVMTVHGAKGLEAPLVILPDTVKQSAEQDVVFLASDGPMLAAKGLGDDPAAAAVRLDRAQSQQEEYARLLYVAMTRARDRLIVCGAAGQNAPSPQCWHGLVQSAMTTLGEPCDTPFGRGLRLGVDVRLGAAAVAASAFAAMPGWIDRPAPEDRAPGRTAAPSRLKTPAALSPGAQEKRFRRGLLIHALLERLPDVAGTERARAGEVYLKAQGLSPAEAAPLIEEALRVITHPEFGPVFGPGSRAEQPIVGSGPGLPPGLVVRGVIDRLLITADEALVLDFKTDRPPPARVEETSPAYLAQLASYRAVLAAALPGRAVRCALLWTQTPALMPVPDPLLDQALSLLRGAG